LEDQARLLSFFELQLISPLMQDDDADYQEQDEGQF